MKIFSFFTNGSTCAAGTYVSYYYVEDVCVSTDSLACYTPVNTHELNEGGEIILFPNPFTDMLTVKTGVSEKSELLLYDIASRKLVEQNFINSITLSVSHFARGIYFYEVKNKNGVIRKGKLVKE